MKLTESKIELLKKVRAMMAEDVDRPFGHEQSSEYICWNILFVATSGRVTYMNSFQNLSTCLDQVGGDAKSLVIKIESALNGEGSMVNYLTRVFRASRTDGLCFSDHTLARMAAPYARLAWLDRMIETGEIA